MKTGITYLASPYTHKDPAVMEYRYKVVCRVAARLMSNGWKIFSPIAHTHSIAMAGKLPKDFAFWKEYDEAMLSTCAGMLVLRMDGWQFSSGVQSEIKYARRCSIPVDYIDPLPEELEA